MKQMRAEGKPLLYALLPIALLATWCFQRLEFYPVKTGEPVTFAAYGPVSRAGEAAHLAPQPGLKAQDGWIKEFAAVTNDGPAYARATWRCSTETNRLTLTLRLNGQSYEHELVAGERVYGAAVKQHNGTLLRTALELKPVKLGGIVPGIPALGLAPWLVAYLLLAVTAVPLLKRWLKVY